MSDFGSIAELRADLQRQDNEISDTIEASAETIEAMKIERRIVAARRETLDQVEAIQAQGNHLSAPQNQAVVPQKQPEGNHPRQRQDVRGPVLALLQECRDGPDAFAYTLDGMIGSLPHLKPNSVRAALVSLVYAGEVATNNGLYYIEQPSRDNREDDELDEPVGGDPPVLAVPFIAPVARDYRATEPDPRTLTDTSPESQAKALRAAVERAGPAGLSEENACVDPLVIAAGIEAGWLRRTEDDRSVRLWIAEKDAAE